MFMSLILLNTALFLRGSHSAICAVFENKAKSISGPLGRELLLGDRKTSLALFKEFKQGFVQLHASENLDLVISKSEVTAEKCEPHIFSARVNYPVKFGTEEFGLITGDISYLSFLTVALMLVLGGLVVFIGVRLLTARLSKELEESVVKPMRQLSQGEQLDQAGNVPSEILEIEGNLHNLKNDILQKERITQDLIRSKELGEQAERLAHDIISPLNALNSVIEELQDVDVNRKKTLRIAATRIEDIARRLHKKSQDSRSENCYVQVANLVHELLSEKRTEYKTNERISFEIKNFLSSDNVIPAENSVELKRILSNLINNSVEAIASSGLITVLCSGNDQGFAISVEDNGKGIPSEVLPELSQKGKTFKKGGSGLGLYYAKQVVETWGGSLKISSRLGVGTQVQLTIPTTTKPSLIAKAASCVLIDNDELTRLVWEDAAVKDGVSLRTYANPNDFFHDERTLDRNVVVYIDSDLGLEQRGEHIAKDIKGLGFNQIYLTTGFPKDNFKDYPWLNAILSKTPGWRNKEARNAAS